MFFGRERELEELKSFFKKPIAALAVCSGRRRIGKSTLIEKAGEAEKGAFLEFYGLPPREGGTNKDQLEHFSRQISSYFSLPPVKFDDWQAALEFLADLTKEGNTIVFLDEISWMGGKDKDFPGKLKGVWDTRFKKNPGLKMILCGSVSSWIQENILQNKGFLGRVSLSIQLEELPLSDANLFWKNKTKISAKEKLKILSVTGSIPRYLEEIDPNLDAEKNLKKLCFSPGGFLLEEFDKIFNDLFGRYSQDFQDVIFCLMNQPKSFDEIVKMLDKEHSGALHAKLQVLEKCGFLARDFVWQGGKKSSKLSKYRLKDNYIRFYLKYIKPKKEMIEKGLFYDVDLENFSDWSSLMGLQFENLVLNNLRKVLELLKISPESLLSASPYFQNRTQRQKGCQIDLLIQTKYTFYPIEIKMKNEIGVEVIDEVEEKLRAVKIPKGVSVRPVLIYEGTLTKGLERSDFFSRMLSFDEFL